MSVQDLTTIISSVGFPIVCCGALFYYINTTMKEFTKTMTANTEALKELQISLANKEK